MDFNAFKDWILLGILGAGSSGILYCLWEINKSLYGIREEMAVFRTTLSGVKSTVEGHESRIIKLEDET